MLIRHPAAILVAILGYFTPLFSQVSSVRRCLTWDLGFLTDWYWYGTQKQCLVRESCGQNVTELATRLPSC
jgi:hypothetical protein